jgi:2-polyprenyl-6-hydroxyphenyl methylase/3-demethylubiquinone-9 3-methyltransferase
MKLPVFDPSWPADIQALYRHDMQEIWDKSLAPQIWNQYHNQLALYLKYVPDEPKVDILDVGCAQATLALLLAERGHRVCALDLRQQFLDYAETRYEHGKIEFVQGNVLEYSWNTKFDLVFANQIIEHLVYPMDMISRLKNLLAPGGRLIITTPNGEYLKNNLPSFAELGDPARWEDKQFTADGGGHFFAYLGDELLTLFQKAGFVSPELNYFETPFISGHMKVRYLHGFVPVKMLRLLDTTLLAAPLVAKRLSHQLLITGTQPA